MIQVTPQMRVLVAVEPADFRKGIDGLARVAKEVLAKDPFCGAAFVFRNRRATAIKVLIYDGQGFWLCHKRMSSGRFRFWPRRTGAAAIRGLLPYVEKERRADVLAYTWQVTAGMVARYARPGLVGDFEVESTAVTAEKLADRAVASGDEHTIKLAAACLREWRRNPDPRLMAAAESRFR